MRNNTSVWDGIEKTAHIIHLTAVKRNDEMDYRPTLCGKSILNLAGSVIYVGATHETQWWYYNLCKECKESEDYALWQLGHCGE